MKKNIYIPGDLVMFATRKYRIERVEKIFIKDDNCYFLQPIKGKETVIVTGNKNIVPITLSQAILSKNGWECDADISWKEYPHLKLTIIEGIVAICNESCSMMLRSVSYVHQLQHLLFGLGINSEMEV